MLTVLPGLSKFNHKRENLDADFVESALLVIERTGKGRGLTSVLFESPGRM
jgi:hypothetical protein